MLQLLSTVGTTWYFPFELDFILWLQSLGGKGTFLYYLMNFITTFGEEIVLVAVMGLIYWGLDKKNGEKIALMLISASLYTPLIKNIACRTRPFNTATDVQNFRDVSGYSFPSGHSSGSSSVFVGCAVVYHKKRWKWLTACGIVIPILVALSRNYLGAHYLTDVLAGLALGTGIVFLYQWLLTKISKWYIYIGTLLVGFIGFFYCTTEDFYTGYGLICGLTAGVFFEEKFTKFENTKVWWRILLRIVVGGAIYIGLNELIKLPFNNVLFDANGEVKESMIIAERIFRTMRYAVINFVAIAIYPMLFKVFDKVWLKWKWIKPATPTEQTNQLTTTPNDQSDIDESKQTKDSENVAQTDSADLTDTIEQNNEQTTDTIDNQSKQTTSSVDTEVTQPTEQIKPRTNTGKARAKSSTNNQDNAQ